MSHPVIKRFKIDDVDGINKYLAENAKILSDGPVRVNSADPGYVSIYTIVEEPFADHIGVLQKAITTQEANIVLNETERIFLKEKIQKTPNDGAARNRLRQIEASNKDSLLKRSYNIKLIERLKAGEFDFEATVGSPEAEIIEVPKANKKK